MSYLRVILLLLPICYLECTIFNKQSEKNRKLFKDRNRNTHHQLSEYAYYKTEYIFIISLMLQFIFWVFRLVQASRRRCEREQKPIKVAQFVFFFLSMAKKIGFKVGACGIGLLSMEDHYIVTYKQGNRTWTEHETERPCAFCGLLSLIICVYIMFYGLMITFAMLMYYIVGYVFLKFQFIDRTYSRNFQDRLDFSDREYFLQQRVMNKQTLTYIQFNFFLFVIPNVIDLIIFNYRIGYDEYDIISLVVFGFSFIFYSAFIINQMFYDKWNLIKSEHIEVYNMLKQNLIVDEEKGILHQKQTTHHQDQQPIYQYQQNEQQEYQQNNYQEQIDEEERQKNLQKQAEELANS